MKTTFSEFMTHFPTQISPLLADYVRDTVLESSRYLFVWREKKVQMTYCTHCKEEYPLGIGQAAYKHNEKTTCLNCSSECTVKYSGLGRGKLIDSAYVVWYDKSVLDPTAVVATWYYTSRDYREDYRQVETSFTPMARYLFQPGQGGRMFTNRWSGEWKERKTVGALINGPGWSWSYKEAYCSYESIERAVAGTPLQYSMWKEYESQSYFLLDFFDLAAKYPCIEYLTKLGLTKLVLAKLRGDRTYGVVNWRGKSNDKVLRMNRSETRQVLQTVKEMPNVIVPLSLHSYHFWRKLGWDLRIEDAHFLRDLTDGYYMKMLSEHEPFGTPVEIAKYLLKQHRRPDAPNHYSATSALTEWRDYLHQCKELGIELTQNHLIFPSNLREAHDKTTRKIKVKRDKGLNRLIAARLPQLEAYALADDTFFIRPAKDSIELFQEGKALQHCVGSYSDSYAVGKTDLFLLRRVSEPDTPLCTVEVSDGVIHQARGYKNSDPTDEVEAFLQRFLKHMKQQSTRSKKSKRTAKENTVALAG
ncbi:PcfJ domain-containing protein [Alicyclobacillus sp. ALC3]|uniref:PcfJ domain-containing protein n=1 Tax=Alicyclobacillus sp. ALC3 TaxID=2796143 RepID=UPI00237979A7|nr:PcfJ domain-containing protein [Alicyclobacillus sp. ALC3]WDL99715.1 PcfJ domain-containing protein [Alicyclobacillus sp. ALC3]